MESVSVTDLKAKLMRETMGTLGVLLLNLGKQTGIMEALRGGDKLSTSETQQREEVETDNVVYNAATIQSQLFSGQIRHRVTD